MVLSFGAAKIGGFSISGKMSVLATFTIELNTINSILHLNDA